MLVSNTFFFCDPVCILVAAFVDVKEEVADSPDGVKMFAVARTPLFYSCQLGHKMQNQRIKWQKTHAS